VKKDIKIKKDKKIGKRIYNYLSGGF